MNICVDIFRTPSLPNRKSYGAEILREGSPPPLVMSHMSHVMCHVSKVRCHMCFVLLFLDQVMKLVGGESVFNMATLSSLYMTYEAFVKRPSVSKHKCVIY